VINNRKIEKMDTVNNGTCISALAQTYILTAVVIIICRNFEGFWDFLMVGVELGLLYD
jgi:hypothetical protein